jgi:hypothetical protein
VADVDRLFMAFEERASKTYERITGAGYLGTPTVQLLQSVARPADSDCPSGAELRRRERGKSTFCVPNATVGIF